MAKVSKATATQGGDYGPVEDRSDEIDGFTVGFTTFREDFDTTPLLKGLPDDRCQCEHWGYVLEGRFTYRVGEAEETFEAGDAFYLPPGHAPVGQAPGSSLVQFSPSQKLKETEQVLMKNMEAMRAG